MSDFGKGVAFGWLTSGNGGGSDGDGNFSMLKGILAIIVTLIAGFVLLYIISFFLVLKDMGIMWYVGLPLIFGVWDLYLPLDLTAGQKLWLFPVSIIVYGLMYQLYNNHLENYFTAYDEPRPFKKFRNFLLNVFGMLIGIFMLLGMIGTSLLIPRTVYYLFVVIF